MKEAIQEAKIQADQLSYLNWEPRISRNLKIMLRYLEWKIFMKKAIYVNIEEFMDVKFEAIKKHESQIKYFDDWCIEKFFKSKYERFYVGKKVILILKKLSHNSYNLAGFYYCQFLVPYCFRFPKYWSRLFS